MATNGSVYYLYNAHGDVVQLLNSSGIVTKTYDYEAYGNELTRDAADSNPFRYCGEYYDNETGFIYLRARYYNPSTGRFISQDPVKDGLNWYAYCNDNPLAYIDPFGLEAKKGGGGFSLKGLLEFAMKASDKLLIGARKLNDFFMSNTSLYKNSKMKNRGKQPDPSPASVFALLDRDYNRRIDKDNDPTYNQYVIGQGHAQYKDYMNGIAFTGYNGCEAIAIHNARVALGYESSLKQVIWDMDKESAYLVGGALGANPYSLGRILERYGMDYVYMNNITLMNQNGVFIISYWTESNIFGGVHTVAVTNTNGKYAEYNSRNDAMGPNWLFLPSDYADRFICGYYLGE